VPAAPAAQALLPGQTVIVGWQGNGAQYQAEIWNEAQTKWNVSDWISQTSWDSELKPDSTLLWRVRARSAAGVIGPWSLAGPVEALPPAPAPPARSGPIRILLVDDDELIRLSIGPMLATLGHEVHTAESGLEALDRLQAGLRVDLVILDMNMPGMSGAEVLPRILGLRPEMPVLMATGYSDHEIAPLLKGRPSVSSIRKPFSLKEIQSKIAAFQVQPVSDPRS